MINEGARQKGYMSWLEKLGHLWLASVFALVAFVFTMVAQNSPNLWMWILGMGAFFSGIWSCLLFAIPVVHTYWDIVEHARSRS